jgi:hypothetical protein
MISLHKKYWYSARLVTVLFILGIHWADCTAQCTFLIEAQENFGSTDFTEDNKGGFLYTTNIGIIRYDNCGKELWTKPDNGYYRIFCRKGFDGYYKFGTGYGFYGNFNIEADDLRGNKVFDIAVDDDLEVRYIRDWIDDVSRKQFVVCGLRFTNNKADSLQYWIAGADYTGNVLWQNYFTDIGKSRYWSRLFKNTKTGGYILLGLDQDVYQRCEWFSVDTLGTIIKRAPIEPNPKPNGAGWPTNGYHDYQVHSGYYSYRSVCAMNDTSILAHVWTPQNDYVLYQYNMDLNVIQRYDTGGGSFMFKIPNGHLGAGGETFSVYDQFNNRKFRTTVFKNGPNDEIEIVRVKPSKDGGYYGMAVGWRHLNGNSTNVTYLFKTDSMGKIYNQPQFKEKEAVAMLQPNPAKDKLRVAIPFYYGNIEVKIYDSRGRLWLKTEQNEQEHIDISELAPGIYFVYAKIVETGETRGMKLVVE